MRNKSLPRLGSAEDISTVVGYLCRRKRSIELEKLGNALGKKYIDPRRILFYSTLGVINLNDNIVKITKRGRTLYKAETNYEIEQVYQDILKDIDEYRSILVDKAIKRGERLISITDVKKHWKSVPEFQMQEDSDRSIKEKTLCFFRICETAGVGNILRRNGNETCLEINWSVLDNVIDANKNNYQESIETVDTMIEPTEKTEIEDIESYVPEDIEEIVPEVKPTLIEKRFSEDNSVIDIQKETINVTNDNSIPLVVSFKDGKQAVLFVPQGIEKKDIVYLRDCLTFILNHQYDLDN